jgi:pimeloyl-ACP methyl ester carboxylesterase
MAAHDKEEAEQVQTLIEIYLRANGKPQFEGFESDIVPGHSGRKQGFAANRCGQGPALIYLPGLQSNDLLFWANRAGLAKRLTVYGVRYRTIGEPTPEKYGRDILEMMDQAGVERAHILGESMGSIPAQWLAANHPGRVESLVIAGGFARPPDQFRMALANALKPLVPSGMTRWLIQRFIAARANLKKDMGGHLSPEVVEAFAELRKSGKVMVMRRRLRMIAEWDFHEALPLIRQPFLYMYGERDLIVPVHREAKRYRDRLPQAQLLELPRATHSILFTRPEETNQAILDFVLRDRSAPSKPEPAALPAPIRAAALEAPPQTQEAVS